MKPLLLVLTVIRSDETRSTVRMVLEGAGHRVIESEGYPQAQSLLGNGLNPDLLLVESTPSGPSEKLKYLDLLQSARGMHACLICGAGEHRLRKEAFELGIRDFLMKPVTRGDVELMLTEPGRPVVEEMPAPRPFILEPARAAIAPAMNSAPLIEELGDGRYFLASSPSMLEIHRQARLLADVDVTVLITGESGTGKEIIAHLIHRRSRRSRQKMVNVNCAALPSELLESELFGHREGAFTGATKDRAGRFEQANRGTLLLDEIGELGAPMQAKLLHVLEDGQFTPLGAQENAKADVRILAATNVEMESALDSGRFREDLYYRLSAFTIHVPPLRERREEIPLLIEETIRRTPRQMKSGESVRFSSRLIDAALFYDWRGNLRELRNFVTRTLILGDQDAAVRELETRIAARSGSVRREGPAIVPVNGAGMRSVVRDLKDRAEAQMIQEALEASGWNRRQAAKWLNISYRALLYKIQQYRLAPRIAARSASEACSTTYSAQSEAV